MINPDPKKYVVSLAYGKERLIPRAIKRWRKHMKAKGCLKDSVVKKRPTKMRNIFKKGE